MTNENPSLLDNDEFHDWISRHLQYRNDWSTLLTHEQIARAQDSVEGLIESLTDQLDRLGDMDTNEEWTVRTQKMLSMAEGRLRQIERHTSGATRNLPGWKEFADQLVTLIIEQGTDKMVDALDHIYIPVGGLNAGDWHDRRADKREVAA